MRVFLILSALFILNLAQAGELDQWLKLSLKQFEAEIAPVNTAVKIEIAPAHCLRTGYNRKSKTVVFCPNQNIINAGMSSVDVIHHEFFHALLCAYRSDLCLNTDRDDVHEALADAFAYKLNPDSQFGENYYQDFPYIRKYQTSWRPGLVQSEHERGQALASLIIAGEKPLRESLNLFDNEIQDEVSIKALGRETSRLNRYRLQVGEELKLQFAFDPKAQVERIQWSIPSSIRLRETSRFHYQLSLVSTIPTTKIYVRFLSREGKELGRSTLYLGSTL